MLPLLSLTFSAIAWSKVVVGPRGPHPVAYKVQTLTDKSRWDPFAPAENPHKRRILTSIFSPLDANASGVLKLGDPIPYAPPSTTEYFNALLQGLGLPTYLFDGFQLQFSKPSSHQSGSEYPVILFTPGFSVSRLLSSAQVHSLASQGFTVITIDHPYEATVVEFPNGEVVYGFNSTDISDELAEKSVEVRTADISYLIDELPNLLGSNGNPEPRQVFLYGHSLGGATAAQASSLDPRILGGLDFDGRIYGSVNDTGLNKPFVLAGGPVKANASVDELFEGFYNKVHAEKMLVAIDGTTHLSFTDAPLLAALRDDIPEDQLPVVEAGFGSVEGKRLAGLLNQFLDSTAKLLHGGDAKGLCDIEDDFEEFLVVGENLRCSKN